MKDRDKFGSRLGFILVSAGCAVGLGNVWKFPYVVGQNGGAAFIVIYLIFLLILGIPIMVCEFSVGRGSQRSVASSFRVLEPKGTITHKFGYIAMAGNYLLMMFYTTVAGWVLYYFYKMCRGSLSAMSAEQVGADFGEMLASPGTLTLWMVVAVGIAFGICFLGLKNGVEKITKVMMIALLLLMAVMMVRSLTLEGAKEGISFFLVPDFGALVEKGLGNVLLAAMGQAFFTLGLGIGSMAIFGSYLDKSRSLTGEAISITLLDTTVALMAGFIVIPSCFAFGIEPGSGPSLVFITLPNVFNEMPGGRFWGSIFFLFLAFAALTTLVAVFENILSFAMDLWNWSRKKAVAFNMVLIILLSLPCVLGFNLLSDVHPFGPESNIMDLEDFLLTNNIILLGSIVYVLFCVRRYGWGFSNFIAEANAGTGIKLPGIKHYMTFGIPTIILVVYVKGYWDFFTAQGMNPYGGLIIAGVLLLLVGAMIFYRKKDTLPN
ncbi:MAG: sodium-dependent transporter [Anaerovoracaceae bacterium]